MEFKKLIAERYSCRKYADRPIPEEVLNAVLSAGRLAPTAKNLQEQLIYVCRTPEALKKIDSVTPCRYGAPVVLAVAYDRENVFTYPGGKTTSGPEDASIVATHMLLAAADEGLGSLWINRIDPDEVKTALGLPERAEVVMLMALGYAAPDAEPAPRHFSRKELEETVEYL